MTNTRFMSEVPFVWGKDWHHRKAPGSSISSVMLRLDKGGWCMGVGLPASRFWGCLTYSLVLKNAFS